MIVIEGGRVLTPRGWNDIDLAIEAGKVVPLGDGRDHAETIDASGCLVGPGFVDIHTHLREPGQTWKEDVLSGSMAAAAGGFTAIVAMPNTDPAIDSPTLVDQVRVAGRQAGLVNVVPSAALTRGRLGSEIVDLEDLYEHGVRIFTDDGDPVENRAQMTEIMRRLSDLPGAILAQHAEITAITHDGHMHDGRVSHRLGIGGLPAAAESNLVRSDLELVARTGVRYHCQHVSAATTVGLIDEARKSGLAVTAEVTPHHLSFTESDAASLDTNFKMYPPLRTSEDRDCLIEALRDDVISVVATDHAPHTTDEKSVPFAEAPRGVIGLETAASVTWSALADPTRMFEVLASAPAAIAGLPGHGGLGLGSRADLVIFDPNHEWVVEEFHSKSSNSPYLGDHLQGRVMTTVHDGVVIHNEARVPVA